MKSLVIAVLMSQLVVANAQAQWRVASLNPCFDQWVPQWLPAEHDFITSIEHANRLEKLLAWQPDIVLYGSYTNRRLVAELKKTTVAIEVEEPTTWQHWQQVLLDLGRQLAMTEQLNHWATNQENRITQIPITKKSLFLVMPNQYSWGGQSFAVDMLRHFGAQVVVTNEQTVFHQVQLEQLIQLQPQRVVLDGFSYNYARAQEWLWHNALKPWLAKRQLRQLPTEVSGCPAQQAERYVLTAAS